ncbi:MAG: class I SAM-dependent methyltransferase [Promethearchaeota archaeon]
MQNYSYNKIAINYHLKRKKPWKPLESFLYQLKEKDFFLKGICIDLGCANGRNFKLFKKSFNKLIGIDNSLELLKIARQELTNSTHDLNYSSKNIQLILGDINFIPIRALTIHIIFSIATIHHIKTKSKRKDAINQLYSLLIDKGYLLLTVWRRWQKKFKKYFIFDWIKRKFNPIYNKKQKELNLKDFGDKFVPWIIPSENTSYSRFYHFFSKHEIKELTKYFEVKEFRIMGGPGNKDNFFILAQK